MNFCSIFFYVFENTVFEKIEAITVQLLVQSIGKFVYDMESCWKHIQNS